MYATQHCRDEMNQLQSEIASLEATKRDIEMEIERRTIPSPPLSSEEEYRAFEKNIAPFRMRLAAIISALADRQWRLQRLGLLCRVQEADAAPTRGSVQLTPDGLRAAVASPRYWRDRDPDFLAEVTRGFESLYPG
jgi:hypothetical protein